MLSTFVAGASAGLIPASSASAVMTDGPTDFTARPGVERAPVTVFEETFENAPHSGPITQLVDYVAATGQQYMAEGPWADAFTHCNGFITSATNDLSGTCNDSVSSQGGLRNLVDVLGQLNGTPQNAAAAAYTSGSAYATDLITFATKGETIPLPTPQRFVTFSVNVAATSCWAAQPQLRFSMLAGGVETPIDGADAINPCTDPRSATYASTFDPDQDAFVAGTFAASGSFLTDGSPIGLIMRSDSGATAGNDMAFDDIRVVDATPHLNKEFSPERVEVGGTSTLTFTVTNTSERASKAGWAFTDTLRDGLILAAEPNVGGTCDATVVPTTSSGRSTIAVTGGVLATGQQSCTITVDVTSEHPRGSEASPVSYKNNAEDLSNVIGLDVTNETVVEFYSVPRLTVDKRAESTENARIGDTITYWVTATNTGSGDFTSTRPAWIRDDISDVVDDAELTGEVTSTRAGSIARSAHEISWTGALGVGESVTLKYSVVLKAGGNEVVRNVAFADDPNEPSTVTPSCELELADVSCVEFPTHPAPPTTPSVPASTPAAPGTPPADGLAFTGSETPAALSLSMLALVAVGGILVLVPRMRRTHVARQSISE